MNDHEFRRVSYADHAAEAARSVVPDDPDRAGFTGIEACRLEPFQRMQTEFDQLVRLAESHARGEPWEHSGPGFPGHVESAMAHVGRLRDVLATAHKAADAMIAAMESQLSELEAAMKKKAKSDAPDAPQLTASGEPHPLQEGGYDPAADPQLPGNISDVEALKEGKTTHAQAEAIAAADAIHDEGQEPDKADGLDAVDDEDPDDKAGTKPKPKGHKPRGK